MQINESIFKAYDIRGIWPEEISPELFEKIGAAFAVFVKPTKPVAVGYDVRLHSKELAEAVIKGLTSMGTDVLDIGIGSTEMIYFADGYYGLGGGIQSTASHLPREWHGAKVMRENVIPVMLSTGLSEMRDMIKNDQLPPSSSTPGKVSRKDIVIDFANYIERFINKDEIRPLKIAFNANFGYQGVLLKKVIEILNLPIEIIGLNEKPDGNFPKGRPDPLILENRNEFSALVKSSRADLGVAWDADADRCFFAAPGGQFISPVYSNNVLIEDVLARHPGAKIIYNSAYEMAPVAAITKFGGTPLMEKVGHGYIKDRMRREGAEFAVEHSAHTFFKEFWNADTGLVPLLQMIGIIGKSGKSLTELVRPWQEQFYISDEINSDVPDMEAVYARLKEQYANFEQSTFDGLIIKAKDWRASIRPSTNEPRFRLNVESTDKATMEKMRDEILAIIRA